MKNGEPYGQLALFDISPPEAGYFAKNVATILNTELKRVDILKFKDGETDLDIPDSVRGRDVFVFQAYIPQIGERMYELENFIDGVKMGGHANRVTVVAPYLFGQRGERRTKARQPIPAKVVAENLYRDGKGADKVVSVCIHAEAIPSIYNAVGLDFEHLEFEHLVANYILNHAEGHVVIASPDVGGMKRARNIRKILNSNVPKKVRENLEISIATADKYRPGPNTAEINDIVGYVKRLPVYIVDDIGDTLGTLKEAAQAYREKGAAEVHAVLCHPVLSEGARDNLEKMIANGSVDTVVFGNTMPVKKYAMNNDKVRIIPIEPFVAEAIKRINGNESISNLHDYGKIVKAYERGMEAMKSPHPKFVRIKKKPMKKRPQRQKVDAR